MAVSDTLLYEGTLRLVFFIGLFCALAVLETIFPRRQLKFGRARRWVPNWALVLLDTAVLRLLALVLPFLAVGAAVDADVRGWGLFHYLELSMPANIILTILLFDLLIWGQHVVMHRVPVLWRIHRVHHSDEDMDVTTAIRFHPIEIAVSMLIKIGAVYVIGPFAIGILAFEIILNGSAMFNHSNLRLSHRADAVMRKLVVTPDMHRVHHSTEYSEHNMNFGFFLSVWDRMFKTYLAQPRAGHIGMTTGLEWQDGRSTKFRWIVLLPFLRRRL